MKRILPYILTFITNIGLAQSAISLPIVNNQLPTDTLRILMIGNSFTEDVTEYIGEIVKHAGIDEKTCCVYRITKPGASLQLWRDKYKNNSIVSLEKKAGELAMDVTNGTLKEIFHQNWDVISMQQLSNYSNDITTFSPYLEDLLSNIQNDCTNKSVAFCWHLTWSYWKEHTTSGPKEYSGWATIVSAVEQMMAKYGIDIIIPSGTAIQNARATELNTEKLLTRDGYHIDLEVGRYIIACSLFETLFEPVYGTSVSSISWIPKNVSESEALVARDCAVKAVENWHEAAYKMGSISKGDFLIFPNPTTEYVFICNDSITDPVVCSIYDSIGKRVYKEKVFIKGIFRIDVSQFKRGTYAIQLKCGKIEKTQRIEKL